jgi:predicted  nucleic acid-binding Zn-ribbon protein
LWGPVEANARRLSGLKIKEQLERLLRIQEIADKVGAARTVEQQAPVRLQAIEERFRERNAEYVAVKERFDALDADQRKRSGDLKELETHRAKYMEDLMSVTNQREYAAILKEIDSVKSQIAENEEAILKDMEEIETVKVELEASASHIEEERKIVETESAEVQGEADSARKQIEELCSERGGVESELPAPLVATIRRLETGRQGIFIAQAVDGTCQSCYVRMRPQVFQEIKLGAKLHACSNCKRMLYHEPTLRPAPPAPAEPAEEARKGGDPVEAVDGSPL